MDNIIKITWWSPIVENLKNISLKGIQITCPICNEKGILTTRWIKGPSLKPLYILHLNKGKVENVCELSEEQSLEIRNNNFIKKSDIKNLLKQKKPFVLFSGGKDSLATIIYLNDITKEVNSELTAIYVDTTAGLPENTAYVRKVCKYLKIQLKVVKPKVDYFTLVKKWGIPSYNYRWCCRELKIKPIEEFLCSVKEPKVVFDGIRAAESFVRKQYIPIWYHPGFKCLSVSPIFYWSNDDVISLINCNGIPKTLLHSLGTSTECWCGAYKTEKDFKKLYDLNKDMFDKLVKVEKENKNHYTFLYKNKQKIPLKKLERQILKNKIIKN